MTALLLGAALPGLALAFRADDVRAAGLNGSTTALGQVTNVQQSGAAPPAATITSTPNGAGLAFVIAPNASRSIIDWTTFSLTSGNTLNFSFQNRDDIALNRAAGGIATINGVLTSTVSGAYGGNVWFMAPGGVAFGSGAVVDVGGLLATSARFSVPDSQFLGNSDTDTFSFGRTATGTSVDVASGARLQAHGGMLALIAPMVTTAPGALVGADAGGSQVFYGAAQEFRVTFAPNSVNDLDLISFVVTLPSDSATPLTLAGTTTAGNIYVAGAASTIAALISAPGDMIANAAFAQGGNIVLSSGGISAGAATPPTAGAEIAPTSLGPLTADGAIALTALGPLTLGSASAGGSLSATAAGLISLNGPLSAGQDLSLSGQGAAGGPGVVGSTIDLTSVGGALTASGGLTATTRYVFTAPGVASMSGDVAARVADSGNLPLSLTFTSGAAQTLGPVNAGSAALSISAAGDLTTSALTGGQTTLSAGGALAFGGSVSVLSLDLQIQGSVTSTSPVSTGQLTGAAASLALLTPGNAVASIGDFSTGSGFAVQNAASAGLILASGATLNGGTGGVSLSSAGPITLAGVIAAGGQTVALNAAGAIDQTSGAIIAARLTGSSGGHVTLAQSANQIASLGDFSAGSGFALQDSASAGFTLASGATLNGGIGGVSLANTGAITFGGIIAATGQTVALSAAGPIDQPSGAIVANRLTGASGGPTTLAQPANQISVLGDFDAGSGFTLEDSAPTGLTLTGGAVLIGGTGGTGGVSLTNAGPITISGVIGASGQISIATLAGDIILTGGVGVPGQNLALNAARAIDQTSGMILANRLTGSSGGHVVLALSSNQIASIGDFSAGAGFALQDAMSAGLTLASGATLSGGTGNVSLTNAGPIALAGVIAASGQTVALNTAGAIDQASGAIIAGRLSGASGGHATLTQSANQIASIGDFSAASGFTLQDSAAAGLTLVSGATLSGGSGGVSLANAGSIAIAGMIAASGQTVALNSAGSIDQTSGAIIANRLTGGSGGHAVLAQPTNQIAAISDFSAGQGFILQDSASAGLTLTSGATLAVGTGGVSLSNAGPMALAGVIAAGGQTVALNAAGAIDQSSGAITAGRLTGSSGGPAALTQSANQIAAIGDFSAGSGFAFQDAASTGLTLTSGATLNARTGGITLINAGPITLAGTVLGQGDIDLTTSAGAITQTGSVRSGGSTTYLAAGPVSIDGGVIVAAKDIDLEAQSGSVQIVTPAQAPVAFTSLTATGATVLKASSGSVIIGEAPFVQAVETFLAGHQGADVDVSRDIPPAALPAIGRVFITSGKLRTSASDGIVQQNTSVLPGQGNGIVLLNPGRTLSPVQIGAAGVSGPAVVDLFLTVVDSGGTTLSGKLVAPSNSVVLTAPQSNAYRINGCVIAALGGCTVVSNASINIQPAKLTSDVYLQSQPVASTSDPTIAGTGNEEIWLKRD